MAVVNTTALTELTAFSGDEQVYVVDDDDGTPVPRRMTGENCALSLLKQGTAAAGVLIADASRALGVKTDGAAYTGIELSPTIEFTTTAAGDIICLHSTPTITPTIAMGEIVGMQFQPSIVGSGVVDAVHGIEALCNLGAPVTEVRAVWAQVKASLNTTTLGVAFDADLQEDTVGTFITAIGLRVRNPASGGQIGTMIGIRIDALDDAATKWGLQIGDYQSQHVGMLGLGGSTASTAPSYALDLLGTGTDRGVIRLAEQTNAPSNPASSTGVLIYHRADNIIFAFNDAGTMRYKSLLMTGTGVTWVHATTSP